MRKLLMLMIASAILFASCGTISTKAPIYKSAIDNSDSTCFVYIYRVKNFVGGVAPFEIRTAVTDEKTKDFVNLPGVLKLYQKGYIPMTLKANTLYKITIGTNAHTVFLLGSSQSITVIKVDGPKIQFEAVKSSSFYTSHTVSMAANVLNGPGMSGGLGLILMWKSQKKLGSIEKKALADAGFKELEPTSNPVLYKELQAMRLSK
jgi:hypothetical protein